MESELNNLIIPVIDTWGMPSGTLHGNDFTPGLFTDCVNFDLHAIKGKYCTAKFNATDSSEDKLFDFSNVLHEMLAQRNVELKTGFCVPQSCSNFAIKNFGNELLAKNRLQMHEVKCYEPPKIDGFDYFAM